MANTNLLLVKCEDQKGLVFKVSQALYESSQNIISNLEFVDRITGTFFMRTAFEGEHPSKLQDQLATILPKGAVVSMVAPKKKNIVVFASREPHCLGDLLLRCHLGELNANVCAVISNHGELESLTKRFEHPFHFIPHKDIHREDHESQILETLSQYGADYLVLAKYMRILSPSFVSQFPQRILNIHHSFLPAFMGAKPYHQAYLRGVKIIGATAHYVTDDLDEGPIISQSVHPADHTHTAKKMARVGRDIEKKVLAQAMNLVFEDRVFILGNRTVILE